MSAQIANEKPKRRNPIPVQPIMTKEQLSVFIAASERTINRPYGSVLHKLINDANVPVLAGLGGDHYELDEELFAGLIIKECINAIRHDISDEGNTPEDQRSLEHISEILARFGIRV